MVDLLLLELREESINRKSPRDGHFPNPRPTERAKMGSASQSMADIIGQTSDICTRGAYNLYFHDRKR